MEASVGAHCALHPEVAALGTCARCGAFACAACWTPLDASGLCATCVAAGHAEYAIPFERGAGNIVARYARTVLATIVEPHRFFGRFPRDGSLPRALAYAWTTAAIGNLPLVLTVAVGAGSVAFFFTRALGHDGAGSDVVAAASTVGVVLVVAVLLVTTPIVHALWIATLAFFGARIAGARDAPWRTIARVVLYAQVPALLSCFGISYCAFLYWGLLYAFVAMAVFMHVRGRYRDDRMALLAAGVTFGSGALLGTLLLLLLLSTQIASTFLAPPR